MLISNQVSSNTTNILAPQFIVGGSKDLAILVPSAVGMNQQEGITYQNLTIADINLCFVFTQTTLRKLFMNYLLRIFFSYPVLGFLLLLLSACNGDRSGTDDEQEIPLQTGMARWYGPGFDGRLTSGRERFDENALTAAHRTLPFNTIVEVVNTENNKSVEVQINDRGPYAKTVLSISQKRQLKRSTCSKTVWLKWNCSWLRPVIRSLKI